MAQPTDRPQSADCDRALELMRAREAVVLAARRAAAQPGDRYQLAPDVRLESLRRRAARACVGAGGDAQPSPQRLAQPPVDVAPVVAAPPALPAAPAAAVGPPPKPAAPPTTIIACDAAGCWASDGSRLNRVGPNLLGPRGLCSVQGTLLHCP